MDRCKLQQFLPLSFNDESGGLKRTAAGHLAYRVGAEYSYHGATANERIWARQILRVIETARVGLESMNLAICAAGEQFGGVERQIVDLCRVRMAGGRAIPLVVLFFDRELAERLREIGVTPIVLAARNRYDPSLVDQLARELREHRIVVVHAHGYKATIACSLAKRYWPHGLVKTEHGLVEATWRRPVSWCKTNVNFLIEQFLTRRCVDEVCYVTDDIGQQLSRAHRGVSSRTIHNGLEPMRRQDYGRPSDLSENGLQIGIVGRVTGIKGIPVALEALSRLDEVAPFTLNIIGTGKLVDPLRDAVAGSPLAPHVRFLGFRRNIYDYLAFLDVLLMPSYHEGLPYTILEAMSLERAIVASNVGGLREVLVDGHSGLLCPPGDAESLAEALSRVMASADLRRELGRNAREAQISSFTLDAMVQRYGAAYSDAASAVAKRGHKRDGIRK
jgi:glycosyltransferase involved in cell wall biosynthesis